MLPALDQMVFVGAPTKTIILKSIDYRSDTNTAFLHLFSGTTPYTVALIRRATELGAVTIGVANNRDAPLLGVARHPVLIETGADRETLAGVIRGHVAALTRRIGRAPDRAILGCTHYEIIAGLFRAALPPGTPLIHQPAATADALSAYFARHPEYDIGSGGGRTFWTTGRPGPQNAMVQAFWGGPLSFEAAPLKPALSPHPVRYAAHPCLFEMV